jgi:16S rRNA (guanine1207-N2)-methyltransferase
MPQDHYFSKEPSATGGARSFQAALRGFDITFLTEAGVFSRLGVDRGTRLLIQHLIVGPKDRVLDLGCGWGAVGVVAARLAPEGQVTLLDINARAVDLARRNLQANHIANAEARQSDGFEAVAGEHFDVVALNPPIRAGLGVVHRLIEQAREHLAPGGAFFLVGRTQQGVLRLAKKMAEVFGEAEELGKGGGYRVFVSHAPETDDA